MNFLRNTKKHFDLVLILMLIMALFIICLCSCKRPETKAAEIKTKPSETKLSTTFVTEQPEYISLGEFKLTAYCGCSKCCGKWGENRPTDESGKPIVYTANQSIAEEGVTIAADINVLPYGTAVIIDGHKYIVQDKGGSITENKIDIYFESHQAALEFGVQYKEVFIEREVKNND